MASASNSILRRCSILLAVAATIVYLTYRGLFTLNLDGIYASFASLSLYLAEIYGCFLMFLYFFQIWELVEPEPVPPLKDRTVDVYIPTYNEDPDLLRGTISAAAALDYPHKTYVLDDGNRPSVAALAKELGVEYINRPTNIHAKAGNLNHAMEITSGEFVVIFDADHVSRRDFITRLLGYFVDERMGFIQTPHSFYNFDNFHGTLDYKKKRYWEEGELFYNVIQPGKNYWNAVSFCGSAAMFRRAALVDVGLVATETITEDMHTGLRMHSKGWNSLFVNERLVSGQAANDVTTFNTQRLRWGEGNLGVLAHDNPLTMPGLTIGQRIGYLGSMLSWTTGIQKLQLYISPMLMLFTGIAPVADFNWLLGVITVVYMIMIWTAVTVTSNGHGNLIGTEMTHMASFWTQIHSTYRAIFKRKKTTFVVTAKRGRQSNSIRRYIMPQCLYIAGSVLAIAWATTRYAIGLSNDLAGLILGSLLLLVQCWFAWEVLRRALRKKDNADDAWRHPVALNVGYSFDDANSQTTSGFGVTCDLNEMGVGFHAFHDIGNQEEIEVTLTAMGISTTCRAKILHKSQTLNSKSRRDGDASSWRYGAVFVEPSTENLGVIWRLCSDYAVARMYDKFESRKRKNDGNSIETRIGSGPFASKRMNLPIHLQDGDRTWASITEGLTSAGCVALLDRSPQVGQSLKVSFSTPVGHLTGEATVVSSHPVLLGATALEYTELEFGRFDGESRSLLLSICSAKNEETVSNVITLQPREKELQNLRPALLTGTVSALAASVAIAMALGGNQDEWLLAQSKGLVIATNTSRNRLNQLADEAIANPKVDENRIIQLRDIFRHLGDEEGLAKLDRFFMDRKMETLPAMLCRAQTFDGIGDYENARQIYEQLLAAAVDNVSDAAFANQLFVSAARNRAHCDDSNGAVELFSRIGIAMIEKTPDLLREFAGLLVATGHVSQAIELVANQKTLSSEDRFLLSAIYSSDKQFEQAIAQCDQILRSEPGNVTAQDLLIDNTIWNREYVKAIANLKQRLSLGPNESLKKKLALTYLWNKQGEESIMLLKEIIEVTPEEKQWRNAFVEACLFVESLDAVDLELLNTIASVADEEYYEQLELFVAVLSKHGSTEQLLPRLTKLLERQPSRKDLRIQLIDVLQARGEFKEAETHLKMLMSSSARTAKSAEVTKSMVATPQR
jgi:cellulose synthase/poly-beta-1,6-N-acetylglucosamine synthase-like glycosyltransferase/tetratricopeptide (TPR) repeat protein